jgi:hypothetical protein
LVTAAVDPSRLANEMSRLIPLIGGSAAMFALGLRRAHGWARTRLQQMDEIAGRLTGDSTP